MHRVGQIGQPSMSESVRTEQVAEADLAFAAGKTKIPLRVGASREFPFTAKAITWKDFNHRARLGVNFY